MATEWTKCGKCYKSSCGRFSIQPSNYLAKRPGGYHLFDNARQDAISPQYTWSTTAVTIAAAKRKADRIVASETPTAF